MKSTAGSENGYVVFVLQARGESGTTLMSIRPETAEASERVRASFSRVRAKATTFQLKTTIGGARRNEER
jgi:hypothetical protein